MGKFKIGDRVKVVKEPFFFTHHSNGIWDMHPAEDCEDTLEVDFDDGNGPTTIPNLGCKDGKKFWGTANMTHLIGETGTIKKIYFPEDEAPENPEFGWMAESLYVEWDNLEIAYPRGLHWYSEYFDHLYTDEMLLTRDTPGIWDDFTDIVLKFVKDFQDAFKPKT